MSIELGNRGTINTAGDKRGASDLELSSPKSGRQEKNAKGEVVGYDDSWGARLRNIYPTTLLVMLAI